MTMDLAPRESAHVYKRDVLFLNIFMPGNNSGQKLLRTSKRIISPIKRALLRLRKLDIWVKDRIGVWNRRLSDL